jgi:hypothetical protein
MSTGRVQVLRPALARGYFALQALAVVGWWLALFLKPEWRAAFRPDQAPDVVLLALAPGDLLMLGLGSAFVAWSGPHLVRPRRALAWLVAGATIYGALYTVALTLSGAAPMIGALLMCPAAVACALAAFTLDDQVSSVPPGGAR